ncbi:hypothetical protein JR316_0012403 [Psilocybe cubensis]|uniref:Uncharacterized protein n=2 Tax=Psilocybe cubensis TaxID=181762 RepID=A0ACB8GIR9_PSICU|nr:hypothetical protein JR316_0012403 [Psilocybe cubensis]KAH9475292.1 hypothetical protein JR316_0012403 [Psilocybe cubensis]
MTTSDLPTELWLEILSYLPRSTLRKMIGVNRTLFELALNDLYEEVRLISDDKETVKTFKQLHHSGVSKRVRHLFIRPAFLPGIGEIDSKNGRGTKIERRISSRLSSFSNLVRWSPSEPLRNQIEDPSFGILPIARKAVKSCPNLREITITVHDHVATSMFMSFLDSLWASDSIGPNLRKISIDTVVEKIPIFLKPLTMQAKVLTNLEEFNLTLSISRYKHTSTDWYFATQALVSLFTEFRSTLTKVSFASMVIADLGAIFSSLPRLPKLKTFEFCAITNSNTLPNPEGLTRFVSMHQSSLQTVTIKPYSRHVSFHHSDDTYTVWLNQQEPVDSPKLYSFSQLVLPQLQSLDIGLRDFGRYMIEPNLSTRRLLPDLHQIAPNLVKLVMTDVKLSTNRLMEILDSLTPRVDIPPKLEVFDMLSQKLPKLNALTLQYDQLSMPDSGNRFQDLRKFSDAMQARSYSQWSLRYLQLLKPSPCGRGHPSIPDMKMAADRVLEHWVPLTQCLQRVCFVSSIFQPGFRWLFSDQPSAGTLLSKNDISGTVLPQDVMDAMIDILADLAYNPDNHDPDARVALAQCLLVSRSFYEKARPRVFHSITRKEQILPCETWDERRDNLFFELLEGDLLRDFKPLATQVRSLTIAACFPTTNKVMFLDGWSSSQEELDRQRERFPRILNTMVNLETLEIRPDDRNALVWATVYPGLKSSIRKVCRTVKVLRFHRIWGFPISILSVCVNLRELSLSGILATQSGIGNWVHSGLDDLEVLEISHVDEELLTRCSVDTLNTLEIFSFSGDYFSFSPDTKSKLAALQSLITLRLHLSASLSLPECFPPQGLTYFINSLVDDCPSSLEHIVLENIVRTTAQQAIDRQNILPAAWKRRWEKVDNLLTDRRYPSLKTLSIKFIEKRSAIVTHRAPSADGGVFYSNSVFLDESELLKMERESLEWLRRYFEEALPRVHTSTVTIHFEYCISQSGDDPL